VLTAGLLVLGLATSAYTVVKGAHRLPRAPWVGLELSASRRALLLAWLGGIWLTYVTSAPGRLAPHYLIVTYPVSFVVQALGLSDLVAVRRVVLQRAAVPSALVVMAAAVAAYAAFSLSFQQFVERNGGTEGDYGVAYRHKASIGRIVRERGLRVANEPVIDFLVTGHMNERPRTVPLVRVRNELEHDPPLHCDGVVRSSGPLQACLP
jgi:hypothetical protein